MIITRDMLESAKTKKGGYKYGQVLYARKITNTFKDWKQGLLTKHITFDQWLWFKELRNRGQTREMLRARTRLKNKLKEGKK